jgi:hypothetical protein
MRADYPLRRGYASSAMSLIVKRFRGLGRGVCSTVPLRRGQVVEVSPVVVIPPAEWKRLRGTLIERYVFAWGRSGRRNALPLGLGGVFNHADDPNLDWRPNLRDQSLIFRARRDIPAGEQLTIDYGWTEDERRRWFGPAHGNGRI